MDEKSKGRRKGEKARWQVNRGVYCKCLGANSRRWHVSHVRAIFRRRFKGSFTFAPRTAPFVETWPYRLCDNRETRGEVIIFIGYREHFRFERS